MEYIVLSNHDILHEGDQYAYKYDIVNEKVRWHYEKTHFDHPVSEFPDHIFRRPRKDPIRIELNERYTAVITEERVSVGCSDGVFTHEKVLEVAEAVKKMRNAKDNS